MNRARRLARRALLAVANACTGAALRLYPERCECGAAVEYFGDASWCERCCERAFTESTGQA